MAENNRKIIETKTGKKVLLRALKKSDVDELMRFINALVDEDTFIVVRDKVNRKEEVGYVKEKIKMIREKKEICIVAEYEGKIIANSGITRQIGRNSHIGQLEISVAKGFRNEGLGKVMLEELIKRAKEYLGLRLLYLTVNEVNERAIYLYKKLGFVECGRIPKGVFYKGKYVDHVYMYLELIGNKR